MTRNRWLQKKIPRNCSGIIVSGMDEMLLIHSPLLGPSSWEPVASEAARRGYPVIAPDLTSIQHASPPFWKPYVDLALAEVTRDAGRILVIGHSGAGIFLPLIGHRLDQRLRAIVFVDALIPATQGTHNTPAGDREMLAKVADDGWLLPWTEWWPRELMADLVPDEDDWALIGQDVPRLPLAFYDDPIPMPDDWTSMPAGYLRLSQPYDEHLDTARSLGWPAQSIDSNHLATFTEPSLVLDAVERLLGAPE